MNPKEKGRADEDPAFNAGGIEPFSWLSQVALIFFLNH
jgi:hypothetical protein